MLTSGRRFSLYLFLLVMTFLSSSLLLVYRPLQVELKMSLEDNFAGKVENSLIILDNSIQYFTRNARTLSGRTAIRQKAWSFVMGEVSLEELVQFSAPGWTEGVESLEGVLFASRYIAGNRIASYGEKPPSIPSLTAECRKILVDYFRYADRTAVRICSPVYEGDDLLGYDLVIFDVSSILDRIRKDHIHYRMILRDEPGYEDALKHLDSMVAEKDGDEEVIAFYREVTGSGLLLRASIPGTELYSYSRTLARKFTLWFAAFTVLLTLGLTFLVQKRNMGQIRMMKDLQVKLSENEARFRLLFDKGSDAILVNHISQDGEAGTFIEANDIACQLLGYTREELLELTPLNVLVPEHENTVAVIREKLMLDGMALTEVTALAKNGKRIPGEINAHLFNLNGKATVLSIVRDITERKSSEKTLRDSERRYASLFHENEAVMLLVDPETGLIRDANPAACSFYEYDYDDLIGCRFSDITPLTDTYDHSSQLNQVNLGTKKHFYLENVTSSGIVHNVEIYSTKLFFDNRPVLLLMVHDVSEKIRAEERARRSNDELLAISTTDKLTGVNNRRHLEEILHWELNKSRRYGDNLSLIMFDLDGFKAVNDRYGHSRGDEVLKLLAMKCVSNLRSSDFFGRWGGDEFLIITPVSEDSASSLAKKLLIIIKESELGVTASMGVTGFRQGDSLSSLLERADKSMYAAKQQGGDRYILS